MENYLRDLVKKRFGDDLKAIPKRERQIFKHYKDREPISHDSFQDYESAMTVGEKMADKVAKFGGSWTFISLFGLVLLGWVVLNTVFLARVLRHTVGR